MFSLSSYLPASMTSSEPKPNPLLAAPSSPDVQASPSPSIGSEDHHHSSPPLQSTPTLLPSQQYTGFWNYTPNSRNSEESQMGLLPGSALPNAQNESLEKSRHPRYDLSETSVREHRRSRSLLGGIISLLSLFFSLTFFISHLIYNLTHSDQTTRLTTWRWVTVAVTGTCALFSLGTVFILRIRRSRSLIVFLILPCLAVVLHFILACANLALAFIWDEDLSQRCSFFIDVGWPWGKFGSTCPNNVGNSWKVAAGIRVLVTAILSAVWIPTVVYFHKTLAVVSSRKNSSHEEDAQNNLPVFPSQQDIEYDYVDENGRRQGSGSHPVTERRKEQNTSVVFQLGSWFGAKLGWMLGSSESAEEPPLTEKPLPRRRLASSDGFHQPDVIEDAPRLFNSTRSTSSRMKPLPNTPHPSAYDTRYNNTPSMSFPMPHVSTSPISPHGSSGSTQGALVYVRMSDGGLVRKLSTIASQGEASIRHLPSGSLRTMSRPPSVVQNREQLDELRQAYGRVEIIDSPELVERWRSS